MVHTDLGVAPLCDALPAKQVSTGGGGGVSPLLQAEDAEGSSGAGALSVLWTELPVETPLLPGSLSLSEVVELQTHSDEQLEEGHDSQ